MRKTIYNYLVLAMVLICTSCSDFTDIQPKGKISFLQPMR